jgi:poly-gamma-glutamate synthesis protein (capsule biosynthesis protein)
MKIYNKILIGLNVLLLVFLFSLGFAYLSANTKSVGDEVSSFGLKIDESIPFIFEEDPKKVKIMAVGDIMLGRYVETLINRHGIEYPFSFWNEFDLDQDVIKGNLEGPITSNHVHTPDFTTSFSFKPSMANLLTSKGFTHLSLANNHTFDKGETAFYETRELLSGAGVLSIGHPRNVNLEYVVEQNLNGIELVWIGINEAVSPSFSLPEAIETVGEFSDKFVIVTIHWGTEYRLSSNTKQQEIAHQLIENGADLIIGHHPHAVQEIEIYNDKLIFYSLGNFIFDQYFSQETQEGLVLYFKIFEDKLTAELIPITSNLSRPRPMLADSSKMFLESLADRSSEKLGQDIRNGLIKINF